MGAAWGTSLGALWSALLTPWGVTPSDPRLPSRVAEWNALAMSRATASSVGTYCELMVSVPGVIVEGDHQRQQHALVLGMLTDSSLARWADLAFGFGYGKRRGRFDRDLQGGWSVSSDNGNHLFSVSRKGSAVIPEDLDTGEIEAIFQLPLLGRPRPGGLARSWLRRSSRQPRVHMAPVSLSVDVSKGLLGGLLPERLMVPPYSCGAPSGAIEFSNLEAWVSYPKPA
jgi:hypothetical protein